MVVGSLADLYLQELVAGVQRHLRAGGRQLLIADADAILLIEVELALELADRRVDARIVSPIGPFAKGWAKVAKSVPTVSIGERMPGAATAGQVLFDHERAVRSGARASRRARSPAHRRALVGDRALAGAQRRAGSPSNGRCNLGLETQLHACEYSLNGAQPLARDLRPTGCAYRPTAIFALLRPTPASASMPPAVSSASASRATSPWSASTTSRSRACSTRRSRACAGTPTASPRSPCAWPWVRARRPRSRAPHCPAPPPPRAWLDLV